MINLTIIIGLAFALAIGCKEYYENEYSYDPVNHNAYLVHDQFSQYGITIEQVDSAITAAEQKLSEEAPIIEPRWNNWYQDITPYVSDATLDNFPFLHTTVYQELPDSIYSNCSFQWYIYNGNDSTLVSENVTIGTFGSLSDVLCSGPQYIGCRIIYNYSNAYDVSDLLLFTGAYGTSNSTFDYDSSGVVDVSDLLVFVGYYGAEVQYSYFRKEPCMIMYNSIIPECNNGLTFFDVFQSSMSEFPSLLVENVYLENGN